MGDKGFHASTPLWGNRPILKVINNKEIIVISHINLLDRLKDCTSIKRLYRGFAHIFFRIRSQQVTDREKTKCEGEIRDITSLQWIIWANTAGL